MIIIMIIIMIVVFRWAVERREYQAVPGDNTFFTIKNVSIKDFKRGHVTLDSKIKPATSVFDFTVQAGEWGGGGDEGGRGEGGEK